MLLRSAHRPFPSSFPPFLDTLRSPLTPPDRISFDRVPSPSCSSTSSSSISASSPSANTTDAHPVPEPRLLHNGALLDRLLLQDEPSSFSHCHTSLATDLRLGGLDIVRHSYSEKFVIRCYEVGMYRSASIETIANLLQEVACNHAQSVGFSTDGFATTPSMRKHRLIWVTTRMHIKIDEYPVWGDVVQIETWCQSEGKVGTRRDWLITNVANGQVFGRATSTWVMMNQDTRRLSRITDDIKEEYMQYCPTAPRYAFPEENNCSLRKIPKLEDPAHYVQSGLMPRRGDLDMNQHVNNVTYIGWILESMPHDMIDKHQLHRITLDYRRECKHDDVVESLASLESCSELNINEDCSLVSSNVNGTAINGTPLRLRNTSEGGIEFLHVLRLAGSEMEINRGRTEWRIKSDRSHITN